LGESAKVNAKPDHGLDTAILSGSEWTTGNNNHVFFHGPARNGQALELFLVTVSGNRASLALRSRDLSPTEIPV
jgi:hypothetical protein